MDRWIFVHVMKTAGTSFRKMLEKQLGDAVYPTRDELKQHKKGWYLKARELRQRLQDDELSLDGRRVVCGHFAASVSDRLPGSWKRAVFLREPVARSLSMMAHRLKHDGPKGVLDQPESAGEAALALLEDEKFVAAQIRDYQTKVLAMKPLVNVNSPMPVGETEYADARARMHDIEFLGLTEYFPESIAHFESLSGIRFDGPLLHRNRSPQIAPVGGLVERLRELVAFDLKLYESALARFSEDALVDIREPNSGVG